MKRSIWWVIGAGLFLVWFAVFETLAFVDPEHYETLSYTVANLGHKWVLFVYLLGFLNGGLAVHFFWGWKRNPNDGAG